MAPAESFLQILGSPRNALLKKARRLAHPRKRESLYLLEGRKLVRVALDAGAPLLEAIVSSSFADPRLVSRLESRAVRVSAVPDRTFRDVSSQRAGEGILALAERPASSLAALPGDGVVVVAAGVQDPGNLGAVARVSEAAGARGLVVTRASADPFSPKAMRGSMGSLLRLPVWEAGADSEVVERLKERGYRLVATVSRGGADFRLAGLPPPVAILLGRESTGLSPELRAAAAIEVSIPMTGPVDSLNVATVAALLLYEIARDPRSTSAGMLRE